MDAFKYLKKILEKEVLSLCEAGYFPSGINFSHVSVESPRDSSHGHAASNLALVLSKQVKCKPKEIAELLVPRLESYSDIEICDIAGPGFINLTLSNSFWHSQLSELIDVGKDYGRVNFGKKS